MRNAAPGGRAGAAQGQEKKFVDGAYTALRPDRQTSVLIAVDPGLQTGFAIRQDDGAVLSGTNDMRSIAGVSGRVYCALELWLADLVTTNEPILIAYELPVRFGGGWQLRAGMAATIEAVAFRRDVMSMGVAPTALKKWATGSGKAGKPEMISAARVRGWAPLTDHEADALLLLAYAEAELVPRIVGAE